jgi:hypothetical protein
MNKYLIYLLIATSVTFSSCEGLDVENTNEPDTEKALTNLQDPTMLQTNSFFDYWYATRYPDLQITTSVAADQFTASWGNFAWRAVSNEPRISWDNGFSADDDGVNLFTYQYLYSACKQSTDAIIVMNKKISEGYPSKTLTSTIAFSYFIQGISLGQLGLTYDKSTILNENTDLAHITLSPYYDIVSSAIDALETCISICDTSVFTVKFNETEADNVFLKQLCHSYIARFMVLMPRTKTENKDTEWDKVLEHTNNGITTDFNINVNVTTNWYDYNLFYLTRPDWARVDCRIINILDPTYPSRYPSDGTAPTPHSELRPGQAKSSDYRLGTDFEFLLSVNFKPERGYYHFSHYRYKRFDDILFEDQKGLLPEYRKYENDLYKAEAYVMTGELRNAIDILNDTINPRKKRGKLTSLSTSTTKTEILNAIFYERDIELMGQSFMMAFCDMRRRDMLQLGTPLHFPVPARELNTLSITNYTFGGESNADGLNTSNGGWFK